jgi:hypothetical protein
MELPEEDRGRQIASLGAEAGFYGAEFREFLETLGYSEYGFEVAWARLITATVSTRKSSNQRRISSKS